MSAVGPYLVRAYMRDASLACVEVTISDADAYVSHDDPGDACSGVGIAAGVITFTFRHMHKQIMLPSLRSREDDDKDAKFSVVVVDGNTVTVAFTKPTGQVGNWVVAALFVLLEV